MAKPKNKEKTTPQKKLTTSNKKSNKDSSKCSFCGRGVEGLPHKCRYCGNVHCSKHLLPENHKCTGLETNKIFKLSPRDFSSNSYEDANVNTPSRAGYLDEEEIEYPAMKNSLARKQSVRKKPKSSLRFPRTSFTFKAIIAAIILLLLAIYFPNSVPLLIIEAIVWIYLSFCLSKRLINWVNRMKMGDDLSFFTLKIVAFIILFIGILMIFITLFFEGGVTPSITIPLITVALGLIVSGVFATFRTKRRKNIVGVWRA